MAAHGVRHDFGEERAHSAVDERPVPRSAHGDDLGAHPRKQFGSEPRRRAVGAVDHYAQPFEAARGHDLARIDLPPVLAGEQFSPSLGVGYPPARDMLFDDELRLAGEFAAVPAEELQPVVLGRIVRSRDHHPRPAQLFRHARHARSGHHSEIEDIRPRGERPFRERAGEHFAAEAVVPPHDDKSRARGAPEPAAREHCEPVGQIFAVHPADAVRAEIVAFSIAFR